MKKYNTSISQAIVQEGEALLYSNRDYVKHELTATQFNEWLQPQLVDGERFVTVLGTSNPYAQMSGAFAGAASGVGVLPQVTLPLTTVYLFTTQRFFALQIGADLAETEVHEYELSAIKTLGTKSHMGLEAFYVDLKESFFDDYVGLAPVPQYETMLSLLANEGLTVKRMAK